MQQKLTGTTLCGLTILLATLGTLSVCEAVQTSCTPQTTSSKTAKHKRAHSKAAKSKVVRSKAGGVIIGQNSKQPAEVTPAPVPTTEPKKAEKTASTEPKKPELTYEETVEYLKGRLVESYSKHKPGDSSADWLYVMTYDFSEQGVFKYSEVIYDHPTEDGRKMIDNTTLTIPLRNVKPSSCRVSQYPDRLPHLLACDTTNQLKLIGLVKKITQYNSYSEQITYAYTHLDDNMDEVTQKRVANALRHLVELSGGKEDTPDPFDKP